MAARPDLTAYRLFHGDGEGVPGLAVDRYADVAIVHANSEELLQEWLPTLRGQLAGFGSAYAKIHLKTVNSSLIVWGPPVSEIVVEEFGARYEVRPSAGMSVGLFLDMREVRQWLRTVTYGITVLNLFAYTCSLGVCAMLGGARRVVNIDVSRPYLEWGKANYALNGCAANARDFIYGDAFDWLRRFTRHGERFDLVIVDPPSFSSTPFSVTRDYARLVSAAAGVVSASGVLLAATNHVATSDARFEQWVRSGLEAAKREGRIVRRWHEPSIDFPLAAGQRPDLKVRAMELD